MAAMTTTLVQFSDKENSRLWTAPSHTAQKPKYVKQRRRLANGNQTVLEDWVTVSFGAEDSDGTVLDTPSMIEIHYRRDKRAIAADNTAVLTLAREFLASDEAAAVFTGQLYIE